MSRAIVLSLVFVLTTAASGEQPTQDEQRGADESEESSAGDASPSYEEQVEVRAEKPAIEVIPLDLEILDTGRAANIGVALAEITGLAGVRRSQNSYEPVVRGLGWERVQTQVNGMPLYGACPARMDPPSFVVTGSAAQEITVIKGLGSVTLGPAGTGGRVDVSTDYDRGPGAGRDVDTWVNMAYGGASDGVKGSAGVKGGTDSIDYAIGLEVLDQGDYSSADGTRVPAAQRDAGGSFSLGHRPTDAQRWSLGAVYQKGEKIAYPSLPMDTDDAETSIYSAGYRYKPEGGAGPLSSVELSVGASRLDHRMSNQHRTNRMMMQAATVSDAKTDSVGLISRWRATPGAVVNGGVDFNRLNRDALRERHITATDMTFHDHMWPDTSQDDLGLFGEYAFIPNAVWSLRFGLRYDDVRSDAAAADDPALGGGTVREAYVRFYGSEAAVTDRDEGLFTGNVVYSREFGSHVTLQGGVGLVSRAAGVTERYFAFALSPNGFLVGNPTLIAEKKRELSIGATFSGRVWDGSVSGYYYSVDDYILPVVLARIDVDGNGSIDLVRGFENTDATLTGVDLSFVYRPTGRWSIPASLFYVRGEDETRDVPLPEIPPLEMRLAGRWSFPGRLSGWLELGGRFVSRQDRIDPTFAENETPVFAENETPGFTVWHLRGRFEVARYLTLEAGLENLLDEEYWEHLTREAAGNVPGLTRGQEIPQPGRYLTLALLFAF